MSSSNPVLFISGPPFSAKMWEKTRARLEAQGVKTVAVDLLDAARGVACVSNLAEHLAARIQEMPTPPLLVAHGTAVPVVSRAAVRAQPAGLVLTNGPLHEPDFAARALAAVPRSLLSQLILRPRLWLRYLASSAGLRRAVINPYVMDHDMVVAVCGPLVQTAENREAVAIFIKDLCMPRPPAPAFAGPTLLIWGDADPLYPIHVAQQQVLENSKTELVFVEGGQHLHPIERPWAIADAIRDWWAEQRTMTSMS
ncbi:MAG: alpha/beta hydrolase [Myxococcota bacterium]